MPNAILVPGPKTVDLGASTLLSGASLSTPEATQAWLLQPVPGRGSKGAFVNPAQPAVSRVGRDAPLHDQVWFEKIHVVPRELDLGAVVSEQQVFIEVWNAFRQRAKALTGITIVGSDGISTVPTGAQHFPATGSKLYAVVVAGDGDPLIDAVITWIFTGVPTAGTDLHITGFRMVPFAWDPNMQSPILERFGYLTDLLVSYRGMEQRRQLRRIPVGSISYSVLFDLLRDAQLANAVLYGNVARVFGVPRWHFRTQLVANASIGAMTVFCDTTSLPFYDGGLCFLWKSQTEWEARTISTVASDRLNLSLALTKAWPSGTAVYPMVRGRLPFGQGFRWESLVVGSNEISFDIEGFKP